MVLMRGKKNQSQLNHIQFQSHEEKKKIKKLNQI